MRTIPLPMIREVLWGNPAIVDLIEFYFSRGLAPDLRLAMFDKDLVWRGRTYTGAGLRTPLRVRQSVSDSLGDLTVILPNAGRALSQIVASSDIAGTPVLVRRIALNRIATGESMEFYRGKIASPVAIEGGTIAIIIAPRASDPEDLVRAPRRPMQHNCGVRFGGTDCGINKAVYQYTGYVGPGSTASVILDDFLTQAVLDTLSTFRGYDEDGEEIVSPLPAVVIGREGDNTRQSRTVAHLAPCRVELRNSFYQAFAEGEEYMIERRCPHTLDACEGFDNLSRHHGFPYAPKRPRNLIRTLLR